MGFRLGILATQLGMVTMILLGALFFFLAEPLARLFTTEDEVVGLIVMALRIIAWGQPVLVANLILTGALQGSGDTKTPMYRIYILGDLMG